MRSVRTNRQWLLPQLTGTFMGTCALGIYNCMLSANTLETIGFWHPMATERNISQVVLEDQHTLACDTVHLGLNMFGLRMRRMSHMLFGWSAMSILFLVASEAPTETRRMRTRLEHFVMLCNLGGNMTPSQLEVKIRSQFNLVCVQQLTMALKETKFEGCS